ncbi:heparinase II/III family protein [Methylobacterium nodulans]|uniref:Heparinase II/III family protein n=1 Tax=Methylobacterium nodulans (strain LMG 21967 / CNCM I-2342 / ORS 2060) TaxID=460265 RepID=B8IK54_METNO|nr:heparinase II/III family protein [Methylobacterium nodulans]ACL60067.1 Heparinase II/III family protein [Methylobacterium nodulans ORS 2060]
MHWGPDRWRFYRLVGREIGRAARGAVSRVSSAPSAFARLRPTGLVIAPQDLRTSDATLAGDIYAGLFVFAGRALATGGRSPFDFTPPSPEWGEALYGFGWLRHLSAADSALARSNARAFVQDFLAGRGDREIADRPSVAARRLISLLSQSPLVLEGADHAFYQAFLKGIERCVRRLDAAVRHGIPPRQRLGAAVALTYAGLCCDGYEPVLRRGVRLLSRELARQILPDGGHRSRDPAAVKELLLDLLPLRQSFLSRDIAPPEALLNAIDRMLPFLRLLRHGDASLGHHNGMGATEADQLATLLIYDGALARPLMHAPHTGYSRLEGGATLLVADIGAAPPPAYSTVAGAGSLSFELSSGAQRLVVNCGMPASGEDMRQLARTTAAHSTATFSETSSCRFLNPPGRGFTHPLAVWLKSRIGPVIVRGPAHVPSERGSEPDGTSVLAASHDGYVPSFGLVHERRWRLAADGALLEGEDAFLRPLREGSGRDETRPVEAAIRFHLHPSVRVGREGHAVRLLGANGETWLFEAEAIDPVIEESVFFAAFNGARRTEQIVLHLSVTDGTRVAWRFRRL